MWIFTTNSWIHQVYHITFSISLCFLNLTDSSAAYRSLLACGLKETSSMFYLPPSVNLLNALYVSCLLLSSLLLRQEAILLLLGLRTQFFDLTRSLSLLFSDLATLLSHLFRLFTFPLSWLSFSSLQLPSSEGFWLLFFRSSFVGCLCLTGGRGETHRPLMRCW